MGKAFLGAFLWTLASSFFGLLQIFAIFLFSNILPSVSFEFNDILKEGVLLFFSISIMSIVSIEFFHEAETVNVDKYWRLVLFLVPLFIAIVSVITYSALFLKTKEAQMNFVKPLEIVLLIVSFLISFILKSILIFKTEK